MLKTAALAMAVLAVLVLFGACRQMKNPTDSPVGEARNETTGGTSSSSAKEAENEQEAAGTSEADKGGTLSPASQSGGVSATDSITWQAVQSTVTSSQTEEAIPGTTVTRSFDEDNDGYIDGYY